jgi:acyl carrier protein
MQTDAPQTWGSGDVRAELKRLVVEVVHLDIPPDRLADDANLYESGLDSTSVVELVLRIEERFQVTVSDEQLEVELFQDLRRLADCVARNLEAATDRSQGAGNDPAERS